MKNPTSLKEVLSHHMKGGTFLYKSYDHAAAVVEFKQTKAYQDIVDLDTSLGLATPTKIDKSMLPDYLIEKYAINKKGKLRMVDFAPDGRIRKVHIGNKRPKSFYDWPESLENIYLVWYGLPCN